MTQVIEINADGSLTPSQSEKFIVGATGVLKEIFTTISEISVEQLLDVNEKLAQSEYMLEVVNKSFQAVVKADLPSAYNQALVYKAGAVIQTLFDQIADKVASNEKLVLEKQIGLKYNDISPKDVVDYLTRETEVVE